MALQKHILTVFLMLFIVIIPHVSCYSTREEPLNLYGDGGDDNNEDSASNNLIQQSNQVLSLNRFAKLGTTSSSPSVSSSPAWPMDGKQRELAIATGER